MRLQHAGEIEIASLIFGNVMLVAVGRQLFPQIRPCELVTLTLDHGRGAKAAAVVALGAAHLWHRQSVDDLGQGERARNGTPFSLPVADGSTDR